MATTEGSQEEPQEPQVIAGWQHPGDLAEPLFRSAIASGDRAMLEALQDEITDLHPISRDRLDKLIRQRHVELDESPGRPPPRASEDESPGEHATEPYVPTLEEVTAAGYSAEQARSIVENASKVREAWRGGLKTGTELEAFAQTLPWPKVP